MGERLEVAVAKIELAGVQHAPEQRYMDIHGPVVQREVLTTTPPGATSLDARQSTAKTALKRATTRRLATCSID